VGGLKISSLGVDDGGLLHGDSRSSGGTGGASGGSLDDNLLLVGGESGSEGSALSS